MRFPNFHYFFINSFARHFELYQNFLTSWFKQILYISPQYIFYYSYYCSATNHLEPRAISNSHFIVFMDSVNQELGKGTERTNILCSTMLGASAGNT